MRHEPKPLVEQHYHIQELIDRQQKRVEDRNYHREKDKECEERDQLIQEAAVVALTDFWCEDCKLDFKSVAMKQVEVDWSNSTQNIAFYKAKCFCGKWCMRLITDKFRDGFWVRSKNIAKDRGKHYKDTLQPFETGFQLLYGKK